MDSDWVREELLQVLRSDEAVVSPSGWRLARIGGGLYALLPGAAEPLELSGPEWWPKVSALLLDFVEREVFLGSPAPSREVERGG